MQGASSRPPWSTGKGGAFLTVGGRHFAVISKRGIRRGGEENTFRRRKEKGRDYLGKGGEK